MRKSSYSLQLKGTVKKMHHVDEWLFLLLVFGSYFSIVSCFYFFVCVKLSVLAAPHTNSGAEMPHANSGVENVIGYLNF